LWIPQGEGEKGLFKKDLLDRLSFEVLFIPPLRERGEDILKPADYFAVRMSKELGRDTRVSFSREEGSVIRELILNPFQNPWNEPRPRDPDLQEPEWPVNLRGFQGALIQGSWPSGGDFPGNGH
jgi:transcriptional regulator with PAS, ATPase and Fis domain